MYHNLPSNPNQKTIFHLEYVYTLKLWMQSNDSKGVHFTLVPQVYCLLFDQNQIEDASVLCDKPPPIRCLDVLQHDVGCNLS